MTVTRLSSLVVQGQGRVLLVEVELSLMTMGMVATVMPRTWTSVPFQSLVKIPVQALLEPTTCHRLPGNSTRPPVIAMLRSGIQAYQQEMEPLHDNHNIRYDFPVHINLSPTVLSLYYRHSNPDIIIERLYNRFKPSKWRLRRGAIQSDIPSQLS